MTYSKPIIIKELPENLTTAHEGPLLQELKSLFHADRPFVVLDCSKVGQMDSVGVNFLLHAVEEALKRNGDVKLAAVSPSLAVVLGMTGIGHLFEIFENCADAVESFHRHSLSFALGPFHPAVHEAEAAHVS